MHNAKAILFYIGIVIACILYLSINKRYEKVYFTGSGIVNTCIRYLPWLLG